jgi:hypothetical protein
LRQVGGRCGLGNRDKRDMGGTLHGRCGRACGRVRRAVGYDTMTHCALRACGARSAGIASITNQSQVTCGAPRRPPRCARARGVSLSGEFRSFGVRAVWAMGLMGQFGSSHGGDSILVYEIDKFAKRGPVRCGARPPEARDTA